MATLFDENSNMTALSALNGVTAGPSTAGTNAINSNHLVNQLLSVKDSRWLQIEVCREYQRGQCSRNEQECKYAHPPAHVDVQNGRVTACYDSIKGRCTRENPKCKYLHPPQHLKDQLLQAGRNNLALKNLLCSQLTQPTALPTMMPGQIAHLVQQQPTQQPLVPTLPFIPSYLTLPAGYHTLISAAPNGGADPYQTPPAILQQLALLQAQSPPNQPQLMLGSPAAAGAQNPMLNQALGAQNLAAMQQASLQQAFLQQLQQQQQLAALYGNSLAGGGAPSPLANFHTVASSMPSSMPNNSITTPESVTSHNSRKRRLDSNLPNGSGHNNSSSLSAHDSTSLFAATGLLNSTHASGTGGGSGSAAGAAASSITPIASATTDSTAGLVALQNQLLLAAAANGNGPIPMKRSALDKNGIAVTSAQTQGLHIYAQHAAQFNPYLMQQALPGYIPVSFAGQLPPRF